LSTYPLLNNLTKRSELFTKLPSTFSSNPSLMGTLEI
jgi:hypothetical protein